MWSLYEKGEFLKPLVFSNGKTQEDIVEEVIKSVNDGYKIIFINGMCGTGKSAIALNLARHFGKTSIVVPIKSLQEQYINDYSGKFYVLKKDNKESLKISSILGRKNFKCKYLQENLISKKEKTETDMKLMDIFAEVKPKIIKKDNSCDNSILPCKIEIKEKNAQIIKDYIKQSPSSKNIKFSSTNEIRRMSIAPACEYWSPIFQKDFETAHFKNSEKFDYTGLRNKKFSIYQGKSGCSYYEQYFAYINSDVIIFNSSKYLIETLMDRKPLTELEIIDECDEFLDSFINQEKININRLLFGLSNLFSEKEGSRKIIDELINLTIAIKNRYERQNQDEILELNGSLIKKLLLTILKNQEFIDEVEIDESNYIFHLDETSKIFSDVLDETFFAVEREDKDLIIKLVTISLEKRLKEIIDKNKIFVMMSGTIHSEKVLREIFGLDNFKVIEAETKHQGNLIKCKKGYEIDCKFSNFQSNIVSRENFLKIFDRTVSDAKPPLLVHLTSFSDLPTEDEKIKYSLRLPTRYEIIQEQDNDPQGKKIKDFKDKKFPILFTTKCSRGIDFPGDICNSIIISKFPYPNISSLFWKIFKKTKPNHFMSFYIDKANRELLQRIYRALRSKEDKVYLSSPDIRVLNFELK